MRRMTAVDAEEVAAKAKPSKITNTTPKSPTSTSYLTKTTHATSKSTGCWLYRSRTSSAMKSSRISSIILTMIMGELWCGFFHQPSQLRYKFLTWVRRNQGTRKRQCRTVQLKIWRCLLERTWYKEGFPSDSGLYRHLQFFGKGQARS